jgi:hypothetical protein
MISAIENISTPELDECSVFVAASNNRQSSEMQSPNHNSAIANNPTTAINPASPAHDSKRGKAVVEYSCVGNSVGTYILRGRRDFHKVFSFEISATS